MTFSASPLTPGQQESPANDDAWHNAAQRVLAAVTEATPQIPSPDPLMPDVPRRQSTPGSMPDPAGTAVTAYLGGKADGKVLVVVGEELVTALQGTPFGDVEPARALAPALETLAIALGGRLEGTPTSIAVEDCLDVLAGGTTVLVPLLAGEVVKALVGVSLVVPKPTGSAAGPVTSTEVQGGAATKDSSTEAASTSWGIDMLRDVEMEVTCELGRTRMTVRQLLALAPGDVVELDRLAGSPADLLVNGTLLARGEVVVVDESFGLRITEIVTRDAT
ncbi:MAG TPA: flagellar motor switch protein FliN [Kineosporiaceae bacterium]